MKKSQLPQQKWYPFQWNREHHATPTSDHWPRISAGIHCSRSHGILKISKDMEKKEDKTQRIVENSLFATMQRMQKENKMFFTRNIKSRSVDRTSDLFLKDILFQFEKPLEDMCMFATVDVLPKKMRQRYRSHEKGTRIFPPPIFVNLPNFKK